MKLIQDNPYRIAGILANSSEREIQKQKGKIKRYVSIGKQVSSEFDFSFLVGVNRSEDSISKAFSAIEQNQDRVAHSLFWFLQTNSFDEMAIRYLVNGDKEKALEIWEKVTFEKEVTAKNFSCFNNMGTLKLLGEPEEIQEGIEAKIKLIESEIFVDFVHTVADQTYTIDNQKQAEKLVDELLTQFNGIYSNSETIKMFEGCDSNTRKYLLQKFTEEPIHNIETRIKNTKRKRKNDETDIYKLGLKLFGSCKDDLATLKSVLGTGDLKYRRIADSVASEIMQCGIDYFNEWQETADPSKKGLDLLKLAQSVAAGSLIKDRVKENIQSIQEFALVASVKDDLAFIGNKLHDFRDKAASIKNAERLISDCKDKLLSVRDVLGSTDELYLSLSSAVVGNALGMMVVTVNNVQRTGGVSSVSSAISSALTVMNFMDSFDMDDSTRRNFDKNMNVITLTKAKVAIHLSSQPSGCYIATMIYGDYNHPKVIELRYFRDKTLSKSPLGRKLIKFYYKHSPRLVKRLKNKKRLNRVLRYFLNQIIKVIRKQ